jgi:beta-lactamase regulating signal transducer with metallopeptidase domain
MTHFAIPLSPIVVQSLGWTLLHFVWQGSALAAALSILMACCRTASARYAAGVGAMVLLVAAPVVTFLILLHHPPHSAAWTRVPSTAAAVKRAEATIAPPSASQAVQRSQPRPDRLIWLVELWFVGVALFSLRATGGFSFIERLKRRGIRPVSSELLEMCRMLQRRLGIGRAVRFCETRLVPAPAVIGLFRPIVLLPVTALTGLSEAQLEAVIAHELAHIRRFDSFVNLFQVAAETLLFYHPAVWWVSRRIRVERENCCDDEAIRACGDAVDYARALTLLEERRGAPLLATGISTTPLTARVLRLLGLGEMRGGLRGAGFAMGLLCLAGALLAGNGFWGVAKASAGPLTQGAQSATIQHRPGVELRSHVFYRATLANSGASWAPAQAASRNEAADQQNAERSSTDNQVAKQGFIEQMKAAGLKDLTVEQAIALKVQGVTPDYVRQMHALGFSLNADELIALRVQGVTPQYVQAMRATGLKLAADQLVGMKVQGVTPEYVREMQGFGLQLDADALVGMRVQGVTPEYVKELRAAGLKLNADQLVGMRVQGVTPEYVREMSGLGFQVDPDSLVGMRVQGVTPEYVKEMRATGLKLSGDQLVGMRIQGVTPEYVKALQAAGLKNLTGDDFMTAKIQGITPEFVEKARQHGFQNLSVDKLVQLKLAGVL